MTFLVIVARDGGGTINYLCDGTRTNTGHVVDLVRLCDHEHGTRREACECPDALAKVPADVGFRRLLET